MVNGHRPAAITTNGSATARRSTLLAARTAARSRRAGGPGPRPSSAGQATNSKPRPCRGWNGCVTRTRRYRSSGLGVVDDAGKAACERAFGVIRQLLFELLVGYTGVDVADRELTRLPTRR